MRVCHRIGTALLCAVLLFCTACSPTTEVTPAPTPELTLEPTPEPTPAPTPEPPPWEVDPKQFILDSLEENFVDGAIPGIVGLVPVRVFLNNGSGPVSTVLVDSESGQELRALFSAYDWEVTQRPQDEEIPFESIIVDFYGLSNMDAPYDIICFTYTDTICLESKEDYKNSLYFRADGAENLGWDIAALCSEPAAQAALVTIPAQGTREEIARKFVDEFFAVMKENGHITDAELVRLRVRSQNPEDPDMLIFDVRFRLKPTHPEQSTWIWEPGGYYPVDASGWTKMCKWRIYLTTGTKGEIYRLDWIS